MSILNKYLPAVNFAIGTTALVFQMTVLYPWHNQLDKDFKELEQRHVETLEAYHKVKLEHLATIEESTKRLLELQAQGK
jgi:hypothetical protein